MTIMGLLMIPLSIYLIYRVSLINSLLIGYFLSIFTTLSVFNIEKLGFSLTIGHFWMIILGAKVIYNLLIHKLTLKIRHNKYLYLFILFSFITIFFPMFIKEEINIISPSGIETVLKFSFHNISQYMYLFFDFYVFIISGIIFSNQKITLKKLDKVFVYSLGIIIILCFIQVIVPIEIYDTFFRNDYNHATHFLSSSNTILRMSGPFIENSMLSLYMTPVFCYVVITYIEKQDKLKEIIIIATLFIGLLSKSSTFIVGLFTFMFVIIIVAIYSYYKRREFYNSYFHKFILRVINKINIIRKNKKLTVTISVLSVIFGVFIVFFVFMNLNGLIGKLMGQGESGHLRTVNLAKHLSVFIKYPINGVGFGSVRSGDLLSTWLAQIGIIGVTLFIMFIYSAIKNLKIFNRVFDLGLLFIICITLVLQCVSVPEPYFLFIWMYYAIAFNLDNLVGEKNEI